MTNNDHVPHCSFCDRIPDQIQKLIEGPGGIYICNACIDICREVLEQHRKPQQSIFDEMRAKLRQGTSKVTNKNEERTMNTSENLFVKDEQGRYQKYHEYAEKWGFSDLDLIGKIEVRRMAKQFISENNIIDQTEMQKAHDNVKRQYLDYSQGKAKKKGSVCERTYAKLDEVNLETGKWMRSYHAQELWIKVLKRLEEEVSPAVFRTWFKDTEGNSYQDNVLIVHVTTLFAQTQLETRFIEQIRSILSEVDNAVIDIRFESPGALEHDKEDNDTTSPNIDDIMQDPEYIRGYQQCLEYEKEQEERRKSPYMQGWSAASDEVMRNKVSSIQAKQEQSNISSLSDTLEDNAIKKLQEEVKKLDERLRKLERYSEE